MQKLISADDFRARFDISDDIDAGRIAPHIGSASRRLRKWVSDAVYSNALSENPAYEELQEDLKNAEAHLTYHFAISGFNYPLSSRGIVATTQSGEGREMRKYLTPTETQQVARQMLELAREIADPHCVAAENATFEIVKIVEVIGNGECPG